MSVTAGAVASGVRVDVTTDSSSISTKVGALIAAANAQPLDAFDGRGLAGAVGTDQPDDLAGEDLEVEAVDDDPVADGGRPPT